MNFHGYVVAVFLHPLLRGGERYASGIDGRLADPSQIGEIRTQCWIQNRPSIDLKVIDLCKRQVIGQGDQANFRHFAEFSGAGPPTRPPMKSIPCRELRSAVLVPFGC